MGIDILANSDPNTNDDDISEIKINEEFARRFEHNKKREALQKYDELRKRGEIASSDDEDSDEDDGDEEEVLVEKDKIGVKYYDALVRVKKGDPVIFEEEDDEESEEQMEEKGKKKKEKPIYLRDVNYQYLNENGAELGEEEIKTNPKVYDKEQAENVKAFLEAAKEVRVENDEEDLFKPKEKDEKDENDENEEVRQKKLDEYFGEDGNLDENEEFLKNYLRNKMWMDKKKDKIALDDVDLSEDEDELEKMEEYEAKYNFRHEEMETDRILGHARHIEGSVRNKESKRKLQRKNKEERIAQAKLQREQELKMLKNLKKKEIKEKLEKFKEIAGLGDDNECKLDAKDLEGDFDPEDYDKKMTEMFGDDYYGNEDPEPDFGSGEGSDLEKPDFDKEDGILGLPKDWDVCESKSGFKALREKHLQMKGEPDEVEGEDEVEKEADGKRKKKRKAKDEKLSKEKEELEKELLEEYYKLNYEDVIAGEIKTRFKYKPVEKKTYGLKPIDIFEADDKKLNQYVSIKKLAPYRETEWKVTKHQKMKKEAILYGEESSGGSKSSKKHEGKKISEDVGEEHKTEENGMEDNEEPHDDEDENALSKKRKRKQRKAELKLSQARLEAYGVNQSKPHKKKKET